MVRGLDYLTMREMSVPDLKCGAFFFGTVEVLGFGSDVVFTLVVAMEMWFKIHLQNYFYLKYYFRKHWQYYCYTIKYIRILCNFVL